MNKVPTLRFKEFNEEWRCSRVEDLCDTITDYVAAGSFESIRNNVNYYSDENFAQLVRTIDLKNNFNNKEFIFVDEKAFKFLCRVNLNEESIVLPNIGSNIGESYFVEPLKLPSENNVLGPNAILLRSKSNNTKYVFYLLNTKRFQKQLVQIIGASGQPKFNKTELKQMKFYIPNKKEQEKIASFFSLIDKKIELQTEKVEELKNYKKGIMQKMFPRNGETVPELRFAGFTNAWEQCKLSEVLVPSDVRNNKGEYTQADVLAASLGTELLKKHIFFGLRSTEESVKTYRVVNSGNVIYTKSPIKGYPNGIVRTNKGSDGIVPSLYCVYHSIPSINSSIIQSYFEDKDRLNAYLYPLVNVGARNNVNITDSGFLEGTICIPKDIYEQNKIVDFLNHLTHLITLHQCKLDALNEYKKGLLQQMFI